ncbi:protein of unknown function [Flexibacter flexilis DSM 6793]|uniref:DUF349 domain-containing protein n=1 Tax=Flexibacter flexilis DSM 6793 TaxID=927664 RepID=A0A1I1DN36_9BACT|nr:DUF349 domain-containing protein [Flexibacter flexilis]SFB76247.1 protein of unknown function [Flexibacter flexilis DSM 6793]
METQHDELGSENQKTEQIASELTENQVSSSSPEVMDELHEDEHHEDAEVDYSSYDKTQLVELAEKLSHDTDAQRADAVLRKIKPLFDDKREAERNEALSKFIADGGEEGDFRFKGDNLASRFDAAFRSVREKRKKQIEDSEKTKLQHLTAKKELLERLRGIVENENNESMAQVKKVQEEWKSIGAVPAAEAANLSATYGVLLDKFYSNMSIYRELKELDRKKNFEAKLEICERAEKLLNEPSLNKAVKELNDLHEEFKNIGPVPKAEQETLWNRFKEVSDKIYTSRREYVETIRKEQDSNLQAKTILCERSEALATFNSDRIDDWNAKTEELMTLQKEWNEVGGLPRNKGAEIVKKFWGNFKIFFANKSQFFKKLEETKQNNLARKNALCEQAEALSLSEEWDTAADQLKELQNQWKLIGAVPNKFRNSSYERFKKAIDTFFDRKRAFLNEQDAEYIKNLAVKVAACEKMEAAAAAKTGTWEELQALQKEFETAGFVPRKEKDKIQQRYLKATDNYILQSEQIDEADRAKLRLTAQVRKGGRNQEVIQNVKGQEQNIRRRMTQLENDIHLWRNNLGFFASSRNIDALRSEVERKVAAAQREIDSLKDQLRIIAEINN